MKRFFALLPALLIACSLPLHALEAPPADPPAAAAGQSADDFNFLNQFSDHVDSMGDGTIRLELLLDWLDAYQAGEPSSVLVMAYAHPLRLAFTLTCDGTDTYTVEWRSSDGNSGTFRQKGVLARHSEYIFGDTIPEGFKGPFFVTHVPAMESRKPANPSSAPGAITAEEAVRIASGADRRFSEYVDQWQGAGICVRIGDPLTAAPAEGDWQITGELDLANRPCYLVKDQSSDNLEGAVYAVSADGALVYRKSPGPIFSIWLRLYDRDERIILPRKYNAAADGRWTNDSL